MKKLWLILTTVVLLLSCGNKAKSDLPVTDVEEEEVLRPDELLKQYHAQRTALDAKIDQTLSEIQKILGVTID